MKHFTSSPRQRHSHHSDTSGYIKAQPCHVKPKANHLDTLPQLQLNHKTITYTRTSSPLQHSIRNYRSTSITIPTTSAIPKPPCLQRKEPKNFLSESNLLLWISFTLVRVMKFSTGWTVWTLSVSVNPCPLSSCDILTRLAVKQLVTNPHLNTMYSIRLSTLVPRFAWQMNTNVPLPVYARMENPIPPGPSAFNIVAIPTALVLESVSVEKLHIVATGYIRVTTGHHVVGKNMYNWHLLSGKLR